MTVSLQGSVLSSEISLDERHNQHYTRLSYVLKGLFSVYNLSVIVRCYTSLSSPLESSFSLNRCLCQNGFNADKAIAQCTFGGTLERTAFLNLFYDVQSTMDGQC